MKLHPVDLVPHVRAAWTVGSSPNDLARALGARSSFFPKQVHGTLVEWVDAPIAFGLEADGLLTEAANLVVGIRTADCLPILVAHRTAPFVGAVHAGWRGLASGILDVMAQRIAEAGLLCEDFTVFFGPCIGPCCYEVGAEVGERFGRHFIDKMLNIKGFARDRLSALGFGAITDEAQCTRCASELPSHRRDSSCERILTGIVILPDAGCQ